MRDTNHYLKWMLASCLLLLTIVHSEAQIDDIPDFQLESCNEDWPDFLETKWKDECGGYGDVQSDGGVAYDPDEEGTDSCIQYRLYTFSLKDKCDKLITETTIVSRIYDVDPPDITDIDDFKLEGCNAEWPPFLTTKWEDNCSEGGELQSDPGIDSGMSEDGCIQYRLYTFTVTDDCGNTSTETTIVSRLFDLTDPEIIDLEDFQLEGCNEPWPDFLVTKYTDNCSEGGELQSDGGVADGTGDNGCIQYRLYTFTVTDSCGNTDTETTRVARYYDVTDPVIADIPNYTLEECNAAWPPFLTTTWADNCSNGGTIQSDGGVADGNSDDGCIQYRLYTFNVTDSCGNTDTETTRVARYYDVTDPVITDIPNYSLEECNAAWPPFLTTTWADNCAEGGTIQSNAGVADGTSEDGCIQYRLYTFTVTDDCGNSDTETTRVSRYYDITDPVIADIENFKLDGCNTPWPTFLTTTFSDNCSEGGTINSDGGVPDGDSEDGCIQYRLYTFSVTDDCGNTSEETTRVAREYDEIPPEIVDVANYSLNGCNAQWPPSLTTTFSDNCSDGGILQSDGGVDDGTSDDGCIQYRLYTFTVTDDCGNTDTETTQVARYYDVTDPDIMDVLDYMLEECNAPWPEFLNTDWIDNCSSGGEIQSDGGVDDGTSDDGCIQYRLYTFTVTDDCGNTDTETTRVSREYDETDPEIDDVADYALEGCNADWPTLLTTTWTDNCSEGGKIESDGGVDDGTSDDGCIEYRLYTFTVTDDCGNTDTETTRVSREYDETNPEIDDVTDYALEGCNAEWPELLTTSWTDNCAEGGEIQSDGGVDDGTSDDGCIQFRLYTFTVTDDCGNTDTETTRVSREYDETNPEIDDVADYPLEGCNASWPEFLTTTYTDNCSEGGEIQSDGGVDDGTSDDGCIQYRLYTFTVTDDCGNTDTETTRVSRELDETDPEIQDLEDDMLEGCNAEWPEFLTTTYTDNCSEGGEIQSDAGVDDGTSDDGCIEYRLYTFSITDDCGNTDIETTRLSREIDETDPDIMDVLDFMLEGCNADWPEFLNTEWLDNCSAGGEIQSDGGIDDGTNADGTIEYRLYTFEVTDDCGNTDIETTLVSRQIGSGLEIIDPIELCKDFGEFVLFDMLPEGYIPGGSWSLVESPFDTELEISGQGSVFISVELPAGDYVFIYTQGSEECLPLYEVTITLLDEDPPCVGSCVPNPATALTPNGDGVNDTFFGGFSDEARLLGCTMHVIVYNRWGAKIFEQADYRNDWDGTTTSSAVGSAGNITTGTYFYIITYSTGGSKLVKTGYIYVATE